MEFMDGKRMQYIEEELINNCLYLKLTFEEQEDIEKGLIKDIEEYSKSIEVMLGKKCKGVKLRFTSDIDLYMHAKISEESDYRGIIECSRLLLMCTYQMFYQMDYSNIVSDGKNIDNIRKIQFHFAFVCMIHHEIAHLYRGHLFLYNKWKKENVIKEHYLDIQTLEWDADCYAASQMASVIDRINKEILIHDETEFFFQVTLGAIQGMMFWQRENTDFVSINTKEHPPMYYREIAMITTISELLHYDIQKVVGYANSYEREFDRVFKTNSSEKEKYYINTKENTEIIDKIKMNWNILRDQLEKYTVFPLIEVNELF